jgi:fucose permease
MWLCRFIFCSKANEPTLNHIAMATNLATGHRIPLGKYLIGSVYHMLHQTISQMHTGQKISCVNDPWWFVQIWLQLYMHLIVNINLNNQHFPSSSHKEGEAQITRGCQTHGEAASTISID